jgi:GWxTD domain-containing protein
LLVYGLIPYQSLQFLKDGDGFSAGYEASLGIRDKDGNQIDRKTFQSTVAVGDYVSTINRSAREVVMAEFIIKATEYTIVGELIDEDTRLKGIVREKIDMTGLLQPLAIYPPFIIGEYPGNWGFEENKIPVSTNDISHKIKDFPLFLSGRVKPGNFTLKVVAKDANKDVFWEDELKLTSENKTFRRRILIDQKPDENLTMAIDVTITQENESDSKVIELRIRKPGLSSFISNVDEALDQMRYVVTDEEYKRVKKAKRKERDKLFYQFWKGRDPSPGTVANELMDQYYYRVSYTNEHFAAFDPGWKTDMGMIYILFGPPDDTQRSFNNSSRYTYETWYYYTINRNFSFYDENGFGDYKLTTPYYRGVGW